MNDVPQFSLEEAAALDASDSLSSYRKRFHIPQHGERDVVYLTGNSLGLQPKGAHAALQQELDDWATYGVKGHFQAKTPWVNYHESLAPGLAHLTGASPHEVVAMNGLTVNLHLLLVSFFQPKGKRRKIICEAKAFPSDRYALVSQLRFHGCDPEADLIELQPREGEHTLRTEDVTDAIAEAGEELALVMMGGVNYFTGQFFDLPAITRAAHDTGALCGFDLAHAMGNVTLRLHEWNVDFACWCSYKYVNSGPGAVSGIFVHERHAGRTDIPRFEGWWGHKADRRFKMEPDFETMGTAEAWQLSNAPILNMAVHKVALDLFEEATMPALRERGDRLTSYLEAAIDSAAATTGTRLEIITPRSRADRGSQLSVIAHGQGRTLFDYLMAAGVCLDWREPNVIRMAPVPLYNSFTDIAHFRTVLISGLS